jgi:predicted aspartyl protease
LVFTGKLNGRRVSVLVDSGASTQFIAEQLAKELSLPLTEKKTDRVSSRWNNTSEYPLHHYDLLHWFL